MHATGPDHYLDVEELEDFGLTTDTVPHLALRSRRQTRAGRAAHPGTSLRRLTCSKTRTTPVNSLASRHGPSRNIKANSAPVSPTSKLFRQRRHARRDRQRAGQHHLRDGRDGAFRRRLRATAARHQTSSWLGRAEPNGYATNSSFHGWIDGGFYKKLGGAASRSRARCNRRRSSAIRSNRMKPSTP